jgi:hypothetical protein
MAGRLLIMHHKMKRQHEQVRFEWANIWCVWPKRLKIYTVQRNADFSEAIHIIITNILILY